MIIISHRGNLRGPLPERENQPKYIKEALALGYAVEIDVWWLKNQWWLGHDQPQYKTSLGFLKTGGLWCHAKNVQALAKLLTSGIHCFWHENDERTLTSKGFIWTYPGKELGENSIAVMPETVTNWQLNKCAGICSDQLKQYEKI